MHTVELLPQIAIREHRLVFGDGDALSVAEHFVRLGARAIQLRDVDGSLASSTSGSDTLGVLAAGIPVPIQFDAAISDMRAIERVARTRVDGVVIAMEGIFEPLLVRWALDTLGPDRTILEIRADGEHLFDPPQEGFSMTLPEAVSAAVGTGVRRLLIRDVTSVAPSLERVSRAIANHDIRVTYSGPVRTADDIIELGEIGAALEAVVVSEPLYDGRLPLEAALAAVDSVE